MVMAFRFAVTTSEQARHIAAERDKAEEMSVFLRELFEPSPYVPVSRLFWNEIHLEIEGRLSAEAEREARARASRSFSKEQTAGAMRSGRS